MKHISESLIEVVNQILAAESRYELEQEVNEQASELLDTGHWMSDPRNFGPDYE